MANRNDIRPASGRFVLRIDPGLHASLRQAADALGLSLNDYCTRRLAAPAGNLASLRDAAESVERAAGLFAADLIGIAAFGSWARDEMTDRSDVDLLIVVSERVPVTRDLYRAWDETPVRWQDRLVEPHFVHLPASGETVAGVWAEVALDGVVLFETDLRLSTRLSAVRRDMAAGRIVRKLVHGQPYWTEAA